MKKFAYRAVDLKGNVYEGAIDAESGEEAIMLLLQKRIYPKEVREASSSEARILSKIDNLKQSKANIIRRVVPQKHVQIPVDQVEMPAKPRRKISWDFLVPMLVVAALVAIWLLTRV